MRALQGIIACNDRRKSCNRQVTIVLFADPLIYDRQFRDSIFSLIVFAAAQSLSALLRPVLCLNELSMILLGTDFDEQRKCAIRLARFLSRSI